ncbi:MAG: hypothetical protein FIA99_05095 [Ruminiclostridium sp.]|nr:hypothetical protein [Ruminiclostridium sp.]
MLFRRYEDNPIIPRTPGTFYSLYCANPDIVLFNGRYNLYFRGHDENSHDQIGMGYCSPEKFDGVHWEMSGENPVIRPGKGKEVFDSAHVLDPATVVLDGRIYLYYTAYSAEGGKGGIGLAVSEDGINFDKIHNNPVIAGAVAPEAVLYEKRVYLFYQRLVAGKYFKVYCCQSEDGIYFDTQKECNVFNPSNVKGSFDGNSVVTVRIWQEGEEFYMTYGGCGRYADYPGAIGLARSGNLVEWERYPQNPVFLRGGPGTWDEGALWFATVEKIGGKYYLWYEGGGSGMGLETPEGREASRVSREQDYGGYGKTAFSQIGLAIYGGFIGGW